MTGRRVLPAVAFAAVAAVVGCFEISAPASDLSAISPIAAAWPAVVVDDVLRDGRGNVAPLLVEAYDGDGNLVTDATVNYIVLDRGLHVDADGTVHGDSVRTSPVRVVAQVRRGNDVLQTPEIQIGVVPRPDSVAPGQDTTFQLKQLEPFETAPVSTAIVVKVMSRRAGAGPEPVQLWVVGYEILDDPEGVNGQRTAAFSPAREPPELSLDTTDATGTASRAVVLQTVLLSQFGPQAITVRVTVGNTRPGGAATVFTVTIPFDRRRP